MSTDNIHKLRQKKLVVRGLLFLTTFIILFFIVFIVARSLFRPPKIILGVDNQSFYSSIYSPVYFDIEIDKDASAVFDISAVHVPLVNEKDQVRCLSNITLFQKTVRSVYSKSGYVLENTQLERVYPLNNLCNSSTMITNMVGVYSEAEIIPEGIDHSFRLNPIREKYYFPFDYYEADSEISAEGVITSSSRSQNYTYQPDFLGYINAPGWQIDIVNDGQPEIARHRLHFFIQRPPYLKIATVVILVSLLFVIFAIPFISEIGSSVDVAVGILLGLWGVQDVLIPDYVTWTTMLEQIILFLYVLLAFSLFVRTTIYPLWKRNTPLIRADGFKSTKSIEKNTQDAQTKDINYQIHHSHQNLNGENSQYLSIELASFIIIGLLSILWLIKKRK